MIEAIFTWSDDSPIITVETRPIRPVVEGPSLELSRLPVWKVGLSILILGLGLLLRPLLPLGSNQLAHQHDATGEFPALLICIG